MCFGGLINGNLILGKCAHSCLIKVFLMEVGVDI